MHHLVAKYGKMIAFIWLLLLLFADDVINMCRKEWLHEPWWLLLTRILHFYEWDSDDHIWELQVKLIPVLLGVPQSSVLGLLLFVLFRDWYYITNFYSLHHWSPICWWRAGSLLLTAFRLSPIFYTYWGLQIDLLYASKNSTHLVWHFSTTPET